MKKMIKINGKTYYFNIEAIYNYFNYSDKVTSKEVEILSNYEGSPLQQVNKSIREMTTPGNGQIDNIKYDLVKTFITKIIDIDDSIKEIREIGDLPFGAKISFNTLIKEGFLVEKI